MIPSVIPDIHLGQWPYLAIFAAAVFEGEIVYIVASVMAGMGQLNMMGVWIAGALGGSIGDQIFFYAARYATHSRLAQWLRPEPSPTSSVLVNWVRSRAGAMILASRFLPGLRIAIPLCCAYADIDPVRFSLLSIASGILWAGSVLYVVTSLGPLMHHLGLEVPWAMAIAGGAILLTFALGRRALVRWNASIVRNDA